MESIGWLAIIGLSIFLYLKYLDKKSRIEREKDELIPYSTKCKEILREHHSNISGKKLNSYNLNKILYRVLDDPKELKEAQDNYYLEKKRFDDLILINRNKRKVGYKYDEVIFEIFDDNFEISNQDIRSGIKTKYNKDEDEIDKLLRIWEENNLVNICIWNQNNWQIGDTLTSPYMKIDEGDLTREKWLKIHNKVLKNPSKEYFENLKNDFI